MGVNPFSGAGPDLQDDESLIRLITEGQSAALGVLYDRYGRLVFSLAFQVTSDAAVAEEITQEVFLQIWNKATTYQSSQGKVTTWITSVARHRAIDSLRRRGARPEGHQIDFEDSEEPDLVDPVAVEEQVEFSQRSKAVRRAIARLPPDQKKALALAFFKGLTHQEIAEQTGEPLGTVKTRIRLAMIKLKQILGDEINSG